MRSLRRWSATFAVAVVAAIVAAGLAACGGSSEEEPPPAACPATSLPSGSAEASFTPAGWDDRSYDLLLPVSHECGKPIAVAIVFHGGGGNKSNMRSIACPGGDIADPACLHRVALAAGMAVVFPNGTNPPGGDLIAPGGVRTWNAGGGSDGYICVSAYACNQGIDDVAYTRALLADLQARIAVDAKRVFASGLSNGAAMSHRLGCEAADVFAAIAPVAGQNQFSLAGCAPSRPVAVLDIHGSLDACWPYPGGEGGCAQSGLYVSVDFTLEGWRARNGCAAGATLTPLPPLPGVNDGTSVVRHVWNGCALGGAVEHLQIVGGGHHWPRGHDYASLFDLGGVLSQQLDTAQAIVSFFAANARP